MYTILAVCQIIHCASGLLFLTAVCLIRQRLPKYIYTLINHYTDANDIWDNVKMLLEGSELTKEDRESQLYDDFEHFRQHKGETIHDYYVRFAKLINDMRNIKMTMSRMKLNSKFVNNMLPECDRFVTVVKLNRGLRDSNYYQMVERLEVKGTMHGVQVQLVIEELRTELEMQIQVKQGRLSVTTAMNRVAMDEERLLFIVGRQDNVVEEDVDEQPVQDLALNVDNMFQANDCDTFDSDVDEAPTVQTMFMDAIYEHHEVHKMHDDVQPNYVVNSHADYTSDSNMISYDRRSYVFEKEFKQKENKYLEEFLDMKSLKEKVEDKLYKQDQSLQTVHMLCKPRPYYDKQSKMKAEALKEQTPAPRPIKALTMYPPNTPATLVPRALTKEIKEMKEIFEELEAEVDQHVVNRKHAEIEQKIHLIANDNLIVDCLSKDVFCTVTDSMLTISRFSLMHEAFNAAQKRIAELESKNSNLQNKIQNDDHDVMVKHSSKLEVEQFNLQLKYEHLKESFENKKSVTSSDAPTFDLVFVIRQLKDQALDSHNKELHAKVNALHDLNERWRAENEKVKRHYKELNNREVYLDYLKHLKESVATLCEIIKEARVEKPFDSSLASA
nr:integrase, catalytic region, zinc finger, CCHC-type, peptidase aspartic, catalytic [Tanacetum cinerariifolium]